MDDGIHGWRRYAFFLSMFALVIVSIIGALGVGAAMKESGDQERCFERLLQSRIPLKVTNLWTATPDTKTIEEAEAIAWMLMKEFAPNPWYSYRKFCSDSFWTRAMREIRAVEVRQILNPSSHNAMVRSVAYSAYRAGSYKHFKPRAYTCATTYNTKLDPSPWFYGSEYVQVGMPVGEIYLYGRKSVCEPKKK